MKKGLFIFVLVCVLSIVGGYLLYNSQISSPLGEKHEFIDLDVPEGATIATVGEVLVDKGVLSNTFILKLYAKFSGEGQDIKAGNHRFSKELNIKDLVKVLEESPSGQTLWVTIPEGLRYDEIAEILSQKFVGVEGSLFDKNLFLEYCKFPHNFDFSDDVDKIIKENIPAGRAIEGFLYPDTYNLEVNISTIEVFEKLVSTLNIKLTEDNILEDILNGDFSLYEILNIASMLEREANSSDEGAKIADIIIRRMEIGMPLGIDATSLYALKDWKHVLTFKELEDDNPYNTRLYAGLPPTPIANPGIEMIKAAVYPESNEYLFYLHGSDGKIRFSKTNSGHIGNKKYL